MGIITPNGHALGLTLAPPDPRNWPYMLSAPTPPPDTNNRVKMLRTGQQGGIGSCTGWGGAAAVEANRGDGIQRSPRYIYYRDRQEDGQNPPAQDTGASMLALCKALKDYGAPPEDVWPYSEAAYNARPSAEADAAAAQCKVDAFYQIQGSGWALLQGMWAAVQAGPFPIALKVFESFERPEPNTGKVPMPAPGEQMLGGHCPCCVDWENDPTAPGGWGWWLLLNSWGDMGAAGYWRIPASYVLQNIVVEAHVLQLAAVPPEPEPDMDIEAIQDRLVAIRGAVGQAQADRCPYTATKGTYQSSMAQIMDHDIGPIDDLAREIGELLKVDPPPPPPPDPTPSPVLRGVYGTYAGHGLAQDLYGGATDDQVAWGPHHGLPIVAPCRGHVELYSFGVGASAPQLAADPVYATNHLALFAGWTCGVPALYGLQTMYVAVFWPDEALVVDGQRLGHVHYGHVRSDVRTGAVAAGDGFATSWDTGIRFESMGVPQARASHTHCCAGAGSTLSPNGDLDGRLAVHAQGWATTDIRSVPGPQDYATARYCAGRLLSDFQQGGHPVPPMPA